MFLNLCLLYYYYFFDFLLELDNFKGFLLKVTSFFFCLFESAVEPFK